MVELDVRARERVVFAAKVFVGMSRLLGEGPGCSTFYVAEDGWSSTFHGCACEAPETLNLFRYELPGDPSEDGDE